MDSTFTFYNATSGPPDSFDPIDFDAANNVFLGRLLYSTPVEFDKDGVLTSFVLEEFLYDQKSRSLHFRVLPGALFEDGKPITGADLAMAIKRMAFFRPQFPVIEKIKGLKTWREKPQALASLPAGIRVEDRQVVVEFTEDIEHPLFRFALELFAIIPSEWINPADGKIRPGKPPESGRYKLVKGELLKPEFSFVKRTSVDNLPSTIDMNFRSWHDSLSLTKGKSGSYCIGGFGEIYLDLNVMKEFKDSGYKLIATPNAWHMVMKLNSTEGPFRDLELRRAFINRLRGEMAKRYPPGVRLEESVFTRLLEGYVGYSRERTVQDEDGLSSKFKAAFPSGLVWIGKDMHLPAVDDSIQATCAHFGISCNKLTRGQSRDKYYDLFVGLTGFWSYDPYGDVKMLFTPNLHKQLQDIAKDDQVQDKLSKLNDAQFEGKAALAKEFDRYIHDRYIYNVVAHFPFVFAYSDPHATGQGIPQSGTLPYPWMLAQ